MKVGYIKNSYQKINIIFSQISILILMIKETVKQMSLMMALR